MGLALRVKRKGKGGVQVELRKGQKNKETAFISALLGGRHKSFAS